MIVLTARGAVVSADRRVRDRLREQFDRDQCVRLSNLIEPGLLETIQGRIDRSHFVPFSHDHIGHDSNLADHLTLHILFFITNDPRFLALIREITGCDEIEGFQGRVYRLDPAQSSKDSWHDDMVDDRRVGMSVNLSREPFSGAVFQLRDRRSQRILHEVANTGRGDAIVFRLSRELQHRNTDVTGVAPKTAFAGWFRAHHGDYHSWMRRPIPADGGR